MGTSIEWTDETWNPVTGCTAISAGCANCYARRVAQRFWSGRPFHEIRFHEEVLGKPKRWRKPRRIFVCSMADLFHSQVSDAAVHRILDVITECPQHTFQILTKRPGRAQAFCDRLAEIANVWFGVSVENQEMLEERVGLLSLVPASVLYLSYEPALGPIELGRWAECLSWVIAGGESGPGARPLHRSWIVNLRAECVDNQLPLFLKQWGDNAVGHAGACEDGVLDGEMVREWPRLETAGAPE